MAPQLVQIRFGGTWTRPHSWQTVPTKPNFQSPALAEALADGREERKRRAELPRVVVHAEVGHVGAQFLGGDGQLDRLTQRIRRRPHL